MLRAFRAEPPTAGPGIARTHQSTLLCWSSLRSWYWLMLRLTAVFTAVPASEPAMPSADMPTGRATRRSGPRERRALHRARAEWRGRSRYYVVYSQHGATVVCELRTMNEEERNPGLIDRGFESFRKDSEEILTPRCSPPRRPHSCARAAAFPSARVPRSEVRPEPPTEVRRSVRGRLRPGRPAVRAKHQRGIRRARWATKTPSCPWATT